jgi:hypothetical protein
MLVRTIVCLKSAPIEARTPVGSKGSMLSPSRMNPPAPVRIPARPATHSGVSGHPWHYLLISMIETALL